MRLTTLLRLTLKSAHSIIVPVDPPFHVKHYPPGYTYILRKHKYNENKRSQ